MKQNRVLLGVVVFVYLAVISWLLFNTVPPVSLDMLYYYSIARKYASGDFFYALNGYWAPLVSWLLALVFKTGIYWGALQVVNILAGLLLILYSIRLSFLLKLSRPATLLLTFLVTGLTIVHQLESTTPDFLSVTCLVAFLYHFYAYKISGSGQGWFKVAISALFLIFCKAFYFYFVLIFLLVQVLYSYFRRSNQTEKTTSRKFIFKPLGVIVGVYLLWVCLISWKYERFVFSATGSYNAAIMTPNGPGLQYYTYTGLVAPACDRCFGNEDYTNAFIKTRNPFESREAFHYQLAIYGYNFRILVYLFNYFSYFKWWILILPVLLLFFYRTQEREIALGLFLSGCLILSGYFLVFYEDRYVMPVLYCFLFSSFYYFDRLYPFPLITLIPFIAFAKNGIHAYKNWEENKDRNNNEKVYEVVDRLTTSKIFEGKRIANASDGFGSTYLSMLSLKSTAHYYGELGIFHTQEQDWEELKKYQINYLFYFGCSKIDKKGSCINLSLPFYLKDKKVAYKDPVAELTVYKLF